MPRIPPKKSSKPVIAKRTLGQRKLPKSMSLASAKAKGDRFVESVSDPKLTKVENAILAQKLWDIREAFIAMLLSRRENSHSKDFVVG
jgi:hypothetical protein